MRNLIKIFSVLSLFGFYSIEAQQVVKRDTLSGTELVITMDSKINTALEGIEGKCSKVVTNNPSRDYGNTDSGISTGGITKPPKIYVPSRELTNAEICKKNPRILGYKIQITTVKSNEEANEVKSYFRKRFPNLKVETDASLRPNYKILAGSYFTKQSAAADLSKIREYFKSAVAVQYRIFCAEAK
ncbi:SPOR domain-containing protein [Chryseobacterium indologenes]|uniref:SPOR domain-containing protein n=1 Tax=Chryseobacterium indologenes TaxID=253 RepID=A0A1Z3W6K3_CHRID|nr:MULTISPECIES: SPOR domain-containing protein [Chryseobacterium]ASE63408.1 SPOR domain-containing protein [Chryseobacterium indologenes]ATN07403.1 SPOR domain-containing protein [Chryseobacterium indologenes]AYY83859.1 SPOR domain-containing protein [Chryseobacterium indologenes]AYZ37676.1 SPOR domain-containing protein [Chryseobacterium indologenes]AZB19122.1 SPOR domain-containing protein [Chryseobacterium indologenes]